LIVPEACSSVLQKIVKNDMINNPLFRPPAEADSLILQVDQGCPYNRCAFCGMYRHVKYRRLSLADVRRMIDAESRRSPDVRRVFLADGDVMHRSFEDLKEILTELASRLPALARVNMYATGNAILAKSDEQLRALRALKVHTLYLGLESGDEETLRRARKAETADMMIEAGCRARDAGLRMSVMVLLGLGGVERTREHAEATANALNRMQPRLLSALRVIPVPGTELYADVHSHRFGQLTEQQVVQELRLILERLELANTVFRANHASNVVPLEARLSRDRQAVLEALDELLVSGELDEASPGSMPLWL
jgi:radical SAM superfamily enzyme YgiQ (UPF0313 family)